MIAQQGNQIKRKPSEMENKCQTHHQAKHKLKYGDTRGSVNKLTQI
jgi:hypothetical protein